MEILRQCVPESIQQTLEELPESLDETYERILEEIKKPNKWITERVLQCLLVAVRPLRVEELAGVLAVKLDDAKGIPRLNPDGRWEDQERVIVSACSSLIVIVEAFVDFAFSRVVQFSHFSVREFLTSPRLATASRQILSQACLGALLQTQDDVEGHTRKGNPLARYAAEYWTTHAQFGEVSSRIQKRMENLFDPGKPYFEAWLTLCDIDTEPNDNQIFYEFTPDDKSPAAPLYYAALCGFYNLVNHLVTKYPKDVNADGGYYVRPIVAALARGHFQTADLLRHNGADPDGRGRFEDTALHSAAFHGNFEVVQKLIEYDADINAVDEYGMTPLHLASEGHHHFRDCSVFGPLLEHHADVNAQSKDGRTPLHLASRRGSLEVVRLLLEHRANVEGRFNKGPTALQVATEEGHDEVVKLLREHGAK